MASKRSPGNRATESARSDDFKLINGIGPAVEKRLHGVGVTNFAQLAALSPADIAAAVAGIAGLTAERIIKQDWIGQARRLMEESTSGESQKQVELAAESFAPTEQPHVDAPLVEPQHTPELPPEPISGEVQEKVEASVDAEQKITAADQEEPSVPVKRASAGTRSVEQEKAVIPSTEYYHPATFMVELLLDENNIVYRTHISHVQSGREYTWSGWSESELVEFLNQSVGVKFASEEPALASAEEPEQAPALVTDSEPLTSVVAKPALAGTLYLRDMKVLAVGSLEPRRLLPHDQPFDVRLTLDLSEITVPSDTMLTYKASIYRKSRSDPSGQVIREAEGIFKPTDTVTIDVEGNLFPEGSYRLAATVILALPGTVSTSKPDFMAAKDGDRLRVF